MNYIKQFLIQIFLASELSHKFVSVSRQIPEFIDYFANYFSYKKLIVDTI